MKRFLKLIAATLIAALPTLSQAGSSAAGNSVLPQGEVATFANRVQNDLAARGANVAIVSRMGRDPAQMPDGILYTHLGIWVYSTITDAQGNRGQGYRVYNLYQRENDRTRSDLVQDSPADFFAGAQRLDAGVIIPTPALQRKIIATINSPTYAALHNPRYSVLANPRTSQYQNCTEHTLDVLIASIYGINDIPQIKANITAYFEPQTVDVGGLKRALASMASPAMNTDDHGPTIGTATFGSVSRFLENYNLAKEVYRITPANVSRF
ncbi:DUF2145 domain-containing protein [Yoonia sp. MH D7]